MKKSWCLIVVAFLAAWYCFAESAPLAGGRTKVPLEGFEFVEKDIDEILYTVSMYCGIPIAGDDTVQGKASFRFAGTDFESAFNSFLLAERLYVQKNDHAWTVSRIRFTPGAPITLDASDVKPALLIEKISAYFKVEITHDALPEVPLSLHTAGTGAVDFAGAVARQLGAEYSVSSVDGRLHLSHVLPAVKKNEALFGQAVIAHSEDDDMYSVDIRDSSMTVVLDKLFLCGKKQYVITCDDSVQLKRALFSGKPFDETLDLLCAQCGLCWTLHNDMYYVLPRVGGKGRMVAAGNTWRTYTLAYKNAAVVTSLIQTRFGQLDVIALPGDRQFICLADDQLHTAIGSFIAAVDVAEKAIPCSLQYIHTSDLLAHLPPNVTASQIVCGTQDNTFFFKGDEQEYAALCESLKTLDCPVKQLRYDLLVIQYQSTDDASWNASLSAKRISFGDMHDVTATLGSVLSFNLDVVTSFGLKFAASLQTALDENKAHVFADTTLHGVNGSTISFKNTNTYRYRDNNLDPDTGKPIYSGVTREISSGLKLDVTGWVSGDGMITSKVTASVSRQGADLSAKTGNPPPTSEKIITTEVRGRSGEPVVLSGLIQNESALVEERTPFISKIPVLGWLFKSHKKTDEKTEMTIYLVPHWEKGEPVEQTKQVQTENSVLFERLIKKFVLEEEEK